MPKLKFQYVRTHHGLENITQFLERRFRYHSAEEWATRVLEGYVLINGKSVLPDHLLETREKITYEPPPAPEPPVDTRYEILYEDDVLLAVSKSGNIPTSPSGKYWNNCLVHLLQRKMKRKEIYAVHRLDRETSGVNVFAKTKEVAAQLGEDFFHARTEKYYTALLAGRMEEREVLVDAPLGGDKSGRIKIKQYALPDGRPSQTRFVLKAVLPGASLVQVIPITGRTHQIRVHAAHMGHPVLGDLLYGADDETFIQWISDPEKDYSQRHLLHATHLTITHPISGERITFHASDKVLLDAFHQGLHLRTHGQHPAGTNAELNIEEDVGGLEGDL